MYVFTYNPCVDSGEPPNLPRGTHWCRLCAMHVGLHVRGAPNTVLIRENFAKNKDGDGTYIE